MALVVFVEAMEAGTEGGMAIGGERRGDELGEPFAEDR